MTLRALALSGTALAAILALGAGCGGDGSSSLSEAAQAGRQIAENAGCVACHGADGQGGVGPAWAGLAGSTVELADGSRVVADASYLHRAIVDPGADVVAGSALAMPMNRLSPDEVDAVVAYIEELE